MDRVSREIERKLKLMEEAISKDPERFAELPPKKNGIFDVAGGLYRDRGDGWVEVSGGGYTRGQSNAANSISINWGSGPTTTYYAST